VEKGSHQRLTGLLAEIASQTAAVDPLNTGVIANFNVGHVVSLCHNDTSTLVTTNKRKLGGERPVTVHSVEIGVADTRELDVDEDLIWARLLDWDLLVFNGAAGLLNDHGHLLLGNGGSHIGCMCTGFGVYGWFLLCL
jgi:hypothetical protein